MVHLCERMVGNNLSPHVDQACGTVLVAYTDPPVLGWIYDSSKENNRRIKKLLQSNVVPVVVEMKTAWPSNIASTSPPVGHL